MRGEPPPDDGRRRYWKFGWFDLSALPQIGKMDYQPKGGASRMFAEGRFRGEHLEVFPAVKASHILRPMGYCVYCLRDKDGAGNVLKLTSEHIIPEFFGAGLELPDASCADCQKVTSKFENSIAREMFDPIRKSFSLVGKNGTLKKTNFPLDIGRETSKHEFIHLVHFPTILVMPSLYPASSYSRRAINADDPFNFRMYNINADAAVLKRYALDSFSSQSIDMVRFAQMIAKIAHVYGTYHFDSGTFVPTLSGFLRSDYPPGTAVTGHFEHVGCLLHTPDNPSNNLHEIEVGKIDWNGETLQAVRVRLFASCEMPSYYVTIGRSSA
ncbi:hypothetical protein [Mesorhizobium sp. ANAO-SY3R2]|uniref:hypothetical protein n=1 Tax=Mesorhizobium sp. ANAO-SY3R2 TaxID=3166644 RepID=UPI00366A839C